MERTVPVLTGKALLAAALMAALMAPLAAAQGAGTTPAVTERFELRSEARVSLHHFLLAWAMAEADEWPFYATPLAERTYWRLELGPEEARTWAAAVAAYDDARGRDPVFDAGLLAVRDRLAGDADAPVPAADLALVEAVEAALPVYRRRWWPAHGLANRAWIEALAPALAAIEGDVGDRIAVAYGGEWPETSIPVHVVPYANPVGAYSAGGVVVVASRDPALRMPYALELVFHEASHVDALERPLRAGLVRAFQAAGGRAPPRLWHDLIFYTAGDVVGAALEARGHPGYRHYGEVTGVYERGERWALQRSAFDAHWRPYLAAGASAAAAREAALAALARALVRATTP